MFHLISWSFTSASSVFANDTEIKLVLVDVAQLGLLDLGSLRLPNFISGLVIVALLLVFGPPFSEKVAFLLFRTSTRRFEIVIFQHVLSIFQKVMNFATEEQK